MNISPNNILSRILFKTSYIFKDVLNIVLIPEQNSNSLVLNGVINRFSRYSQYHSLYKTGYINNINKDF